MTPLGPIHITDLFPLLDEKLLSVLRSISLKEWSNQTIAPQWKVKDVAAHLLNGNIRALSQFRDNYFNEEPVSIQTIRDLTVFLDQLNAEWVKAMKRVSPEMIIELLSITGKAYCTTIQALKPFDKAPFPVAWAGEVESANWFHIAREYTEKWHHQQQIRLAVGQADPLYIKQFYFPHLDTSMRALPYHYRHIKGETGEVIRFIITGNGGGEWFLFNEGGQWLLVSGVTMEPVCEVTIDGSIAWRMFTKGISRDEARAHVNISGKKELGDEIFGMLAVMG